MLTTLHHKGDHGEYCHSLKWESRFTLGLNAAKITNYKKNCLNKSCWELNFVQKSQWTHFSISPRSGAELRGSKDGYVSNIILHWNGKSDSFLGWRLPKLPIISNNCSNKSCWELNFVLKSQWMHMSISTRDGVGLLERLICFKYLLYGNGKVVSLSGWALPKLPIISKNCSELNFVQKSRWAHMSISRRSGAVELRAPVLSLI